MKKQETFSHCSNSDPNHGRRANILGLAAAFSPRFHPTGGRRPAAAASGAWMQAQNRRSNPHPRQHSVGIASHWKYEWMYACRLSAREIVRPKLIQQTEKLPRSPPGSRQTAQPVDSGWEMWMEWMQHDCVLPVPCRLTGCSSEWNGMFNGKVGCFGFKRYKSIKTSESWLWKRQRIYHSFNWTVEGDAWPKARLHQKESETKD